MSVNYFKFFTDNCDDVYLVDGHIEVNLDEYSDENYIELHREDLVRMIEVLDEQEGKKNGNNEKK